MVSGAASPIHFTAEASHARELVRNLHQARARIYWTDFGVTAVTGWGFFLAACFQPVVSMRMALYLAVAAAALYRGLCFVHEISHLGPNAVRGFEPAWNAVFGYPLLMPSFVYCGVHQIHHKLSTYGTREDPEYLSFARSSRMTVIFALESFFIPVALLLRFLVLTPFGLANRKIHSWLVVHASSLTMNVAYRREASASLVRSVRLHSLAVWLIWLAVVLLAIFHVLPWRVFLLWLAVSAVISFVNTLRTLGAHAYESTGEALDRRGQLLDSIDTPGAPWTELWAPVGLRYHALHHYFPGIPYHNLGAAYRLLLEELPQDAVYRNVTSPGLRVSLCDLYRKGRG
jgi:fatty acid desaturase